MNKNYSKEQELVILTARLTFNTKTKERINYIIENNKINWYIFFQYCLYHKTLTLSWKNLKEIKPTLKFPKYLNFIIRTSYEAIKKQNFYYIEESKKIEQQMIKNNIPIIPVKGISFIQNIYKDQGTRYLGDADYLVKYVNIDQIKDIMLELGYINGEYDEHTMQIIPITRLEELKWKSFMSNLYPFRKLSGLEIFPTYKIDFRFCLDDSLEKNSVNEILDSLDDIKNEHILIHLCCHLYSEAKHTSSIYLGKDLNLIKLCDIREFIIKCSDKNIIEKTIKFASKYSLEKQVFYTLTLLDIVYNDGYEQIYLDKINLNKNELLNSYGDNLQNLNKFFSKNLLDRLFSCDNSIELESIPTFFR